MPGRLTLRPKFDSSISSTMIMRKSIVSFSVGLAVLIILVIWVLFASQSVQAATLDTMVGDKTNPPPNAPVLSNSPLVTETVYLPQVYGLGKIYPSLPLGQVTMNNGPYSCDATTDQNCYDLTVACAQVAEPIAVTIKIGSPDPMATARGTFMFFSGGSGEGYWENIASIPIPVDGPIDGLTVTSLPSSPEVAILYPEMIAHLRANGFRTVQVKWGANWFQSKTGVEEGISALACRPATLMKWVYDNLHGGLWDEAFCADGHSNGATQLGYSLARYGMAAYLDLAVFESGPNFTLMDQACIQDDPTYQDVWLDNQDRKFFDYSYGANGTNGPCYFKRTSYRSAFQNDSLGLGNWQFLYPRTMAAFFFGDLDTSKTRNHGIRYYDVIAANNSPLLSRMDLPNGNHNIGATPEGQLALETTYLNECKVR